MLKYVDVSLPEASDDEIVQAFVNAMTNKTVLVHITHMVNYNGQIIDESELGISNKNRALAYGDGIFDTIRFENHSLNFITQT